MHLDEASYQRVLGDEIRKVRKQRGWTRKELQQHLMSDISLQTLATYELGTRHCSVVRLVELCVAMNVLPQDLLARVHERVFADERPGHVRVDLVRVSRDQQPELLPLQRWARDRLNRSEPGKSAEVQFDLAALERMAELCGMATIDLISRLRQISVAATPAPAGNSSG